MKIKFADKQGAQALDLNQLLSYFEGYGIVSGGEVTDGSTPFTVDVSAVTGFFDGVEVTESADTIDLKPHVNPFSPRKVLICLVDTGGYTVVPGDTEVPRPRADIRFETARPSYPDLKDDNTKIPLAGVWIGSNADEIVTADIQDRRVSPDIRLRSAELDYGVINESLTDAAGIVHTDALANLSDVPDAAGIIDAINNDPNHGATADHDYRSNIEIRDAVEDNVEVTALLGSVGTSGQVLITDGSKPVWVDQAGDPYNQSLNTNDNVTFNSVTSENVDVNNSITWPDGTVTTTSPAASAGAVAVFNDLGDVQTGTLASRPAPDGTNGWYFTTDSNGVFFDTGTWTLIAEHPSNITAGDLGFDPATQGELGSHTGNTSNPHSVTTTQIGAIPSGVGTVTASNLDFDPATQLELDTHTGNATIHQTKYTDGEAVAAIEADGQLNIDILGDAATVGGSLPSAFASSTHNHTGGSLGTLANEVSAAFVDDLDAKVYNGIVNAAHVDFADGQSAVNYASNNGHGMVIFPPGDYGTISLTSTHNGLILKGLGRATNPTQSARITNSTGNALALTNVEDVIVENLRMSSPTPSGNNGIRMDNTSKHITIRDCHILDAVNHGISCATFRGLITGCQAFAANIGGNGIQLEIASSHIAVTGNFNIGTINNTGTNNSIGANT